MTFYVYDIETSGLAARAQRIMQFAGQRTDENFQPIGEPQNWLVKLSDEVLPDPDAVLITGITPQKTHQEGYTEAEFLRLLHKEVLQPDTVIMGFNTIRFDDEFMRATLWRNFYDPYEWQWQDGRSRWDLLDAVRLVRALRPEGITWPFEERPLTASEHGKVVDTKQKTERVASNRLELLAKENKLAHDNAHDALSDVHATIAVARLLKQKQPKIFEYLLAVRGKKKAAELVNPEDPKPFVYASGRYSSKWEKTTVAFPVGTTSTGAVLVYDLRQDPSAFAGLSDAQLQEKLFSTDKTTGVLPVKQLRLNACPAIAPIGVLDKKSQTRIGLSLKTVEAHLKKLKNQQDVVVKISHLFGLADEARRATYQTAADPDFQLYDGFVGDADKVKMRAVRAADVSGLADLALDFSDERLTQLLPRYKARNFPKSLNKSEQEAWERYRTERLQQGAAGQLSLQQFMQRLEELAGLKTDETSQFLLEELRLYAQNIVPDSAS